MTDRKDAYLPDPFKPAWWCRNRHMQTLWGVLARRHKKFIMKPERIELPDGDFIDLAWVGTQGPLLIVLHGLEGSIHSHYAKGILSAIADNGWQAVFMHFRNCSEHPNRLSRSYHAGDTGDINFLYQTIQSRHPDIPCFAIGFSLGGNVLLKWLAEKNPSLMAACVVSVPFDLKKSVLHLSNGFSRIYEKKLLHSLKRSMKRKTSNHINCHHIKTIYEFDNEVTSALHGFRDADDYYAQNNSLQFLSKIVSNTLIIHAEDDPFHPPDLHLRETPMSNSITLALSERGGHVGFVGQTQWGLPHYYVESCALEYFKSFLKT